MYRSEIDAEPFMVYLNKKIYKLDWLQFPKLESGSSVDIGIDQSSTSTGLRIQGDGLSFMCELPRGDMSVYTYKRALTEEFDRLFDGLYINHFIFEKHGQHITPLHSLINTITDEIKKYSRSRMGNDVIIKGILPTVWRKGFLDKQKYSGRFHREDVKLACVEEVINLEPETEKYMKYSQKDYDGFESYGIINGYLNMNYTQDGMRIVNSSMEFRNGRSYNYLIRKCISELEQKELSIIRDQYGGSSCPVLQCNTELLLNDSLNRVIGEYDRAIIRYDKHSEFCRFILETKEVYTPGEMYLVYVYS